MTVTAILVSMKVPQEALKRAALPMVAALVQSGGDARLLKFPRTLAQIVRKLVPG